MLVLSRKTDESIECLLPSGEVLRVLVVEIRGDKTRIGIDAPKHIPVHRSEVARRLERHCVLDIRKPTETNDAGV